MKRLTLSAVILNLVFGCVLASAQGLPEDVQKSMDYLTGNWTYEGAVGDAAVQGRVSIRWAPGNHCQIRNFTMWAKDAPDQKVYGTAIFGYNAAKGHAIERAYWSDGKFSKTCYFNYASGASGGVIEGERLLINGEERAEGTVRAERKSEDEFIWTAKMEGGEEVKLHARRAARTDKAKSQ